MTKEEFKKAYSEFRLFENETGHSPSVIEYREYEKRTEESLIVLLESIYISKDFSYDFTRKNIDIRLKFYKKRKLRKGKNIGKTITLKMMNRFKFRFALEEYRYQIMKNNKGDVK